MADLKPPRRDAVLPLTAAGLAVAYLGAVWLPAVALAGVVVFAFVATSAIACRYRPSRRLRLALFAISVWLVAGLALVWWLRDRPAAGLLAALLGLFAMPLPLVPILYSRTFEEPTR